MVDIARQAPGFAGIMTDSTGTLTISVTAVARRAEVASAVAALLGRHGMPPAKTVTFRKVDYAFDQLRAWYVRFIATPRIPGITSGYIDVVRNRVHVSGLNERTVASVRSRFDELGVPKKAVIVDIGPPDVINARD
jgi:hypothetical protein